MTYYRCAIKEVRTKFEVLDEEVSNELVEGEIIGKNTLASEEKRIHHVFLKKNVYCIKGDFKDKDQLLTAIFWERCFEMPFEHHEYFDTHRMGARWIVENISKPKNDFLYLKEQEDFIHEGESYAGYRTIFYGPDFKYDEDWTLVRKGLINGYPYDEIIYNPCLDEVGKDVLHGQNPEEVFWR